MRFCIIAGSGSLPHEVGGKLAQEGHDVSIIAVKSFAKLEDFEFAKNGIELQIAKIGKAIEFMKSQKITHVVFAGGVRRPNLFSIIPDTEGAKLLTRLLKEKLLGDDKLLTIVLSFFEEYGFKIVSAHDIVAYKNIDRGINTNMSEVPQEIMMNIEIGVAASKILGRLDIGQSLIVSERRIVAVEGAEGTHEMILRSKNYVTSDSVLVKMKKEEQDMRVDAPSIGLQTVEAAASIGISCIAIDENVIILDYKDTLAKANSLGIFLYVIK